MLGKPYKVPAAAVMVSENGVAEWVLKHHSYANMLLQAVLAMVSFGV